MKIFTSIKQVMEYYFPEDIKLPQLITYEGESMPRTDPNKINYVMERTRIMTNIALVKAGKPCSKILVHAENVETFQAVVQKEGVYSYTKPSLTSESWTALWIFKHKHMLQVINKLPDNPETPFDHWLLGKAFGYSDEAIMEFINEVQQDRFPIILES